MTNGTDILDDDEWDVDPWADLDDDDDYFEEDYFDEWDEGDLNSYTIH